MFRLILLLGLISLLFFVSLALADIPKLVNYQGMLTESDGTTPVADDQYNLGFKIYGSQSGDDSLWWEYHLNVQVTNGLFNAILGSQSALNLPFDTEYWLETIVETEIMPTRLQFTSVGYAYRALVADSATVAVSAPTGGGWTDDGTVVRLENSTDSVGVGNTNPTAKLDVSGDVNINSSYKIGGNTVLDVPGTQNIFVGVGAGVNNTGMQGTFVGHDAGQNNAGHYNTFVGKSAGQQARAGGNTYVGSYAGCSDTSGFNNTFIGQYAGYSNTSGNNNTFIGRRSGYSNSTGIYNVFIGNDAGYNETGSNKFYVANSQTDPPLLYGDFYTGSVGIATTNPGQQLDVDLGNIIVQGIGSFDSNGEEGIVYLGSVHHYIKGVYGFGVKIGTYAVGDVISIEEITGDVGIGTTDPQGYKLFVDGSAAKPGGGSWDTPSDIRLKKVNGAYECGLPEISQLTPTHYNYREGNELGLATEREFVGLVAQDVQSIIPDAVSENEQGYLMLNSDPIIWAMLNAIKELKAQNDELRRRIEALEDR